MIKELFEIETEEALRSIRINDFGSEGGGTVIKESSTKPLSCWPDYGLHTDIAGAKAQLKSNDKVKKTKLKKKK